MSPNRHFVCATEFLEPLETVAKGYRQTKRTAIDERRTRSQLVDNKGDRLLEGFGVGAGLGLDVWGNMLATLDDGVVAEGDKVWAEDDKVWGEVDEAWAEDDEAWAEDDEVWVTGSSPLLVETPQPWLWWALVDADDGRTYGSERENTYSGAIPILSIVATDANWVALSGGENAGRSATATSDVGRGAAVWFSRRAGVLG
jgi:hypothetical protein